jgi:hypothetical protein
MTGMPKYTPEGWQRLCAVADDAEDMASFAEQWEKSLRIARQFERQGIKVEWFPADVYYVDQMVTWCRREGHLVDQRGRAAFGAGLQAYRNSKHGRET